ncbi:hypothetical protein F5Y17DRAFT_449338 [Xylariaceae sp. FL0594]|nr:hypothetical protein F5Y17DRAFT_449338 [Xylariaceae sp. FL0594]
MEVPGQVIKSARSLTLDLPPSCIEFCPAYPEYFVVGTYNLQKDTVLEAEESGAPNKDDGHPNAVKPQTRNGSLVVFRLAKDAYDLSHVRTVSYPSALLDLRFHPVQDKQDVFATVSSTGSLSFFRLSPCQGTSALLDELATHRPLGNDESILILSCAWHPTLPDLLALTTSDHHVHILRVDDSWNVYRTSSVPVITHTLEAWTVAFSPFVEPPTDPAGNAEYDSSGAAQVLTVYSGGDDSKLRAAACLRAGDGITTPNPMVVVKGHTAGVTAILPLPLALSDGSQLVLSGSYDDHIRVYAVDVQVGGVILCPPRMINETDLGGGVWRLKLIRVETVNHEGDSRQKIWSVLVLASCMHAGCRILEIMGDYSHAGQVEVKVLWRFEEHESMNYGSDFQPETDRGGRPLRCVSTSFYDRLVCLWTV